jgi:hypothetical protein
MRTLLKIGLTTGTAALLTGYLSVTLAAYSAHMLHLAWVKRKYDRDVLHAH